MADDEIDMLEECCFHYEAKEQADGGVEITIRAERRFANLWIVKLNGLKTNMQEITCYESDDE
ncbi:MAG TPA: hypothetical protein VGI40_13500 [Pirellulaceae bacterium]|jgi:hypothetical protein